MFAIDLAVLLKYKQMNYRIKQLVKSEMKVLVRYLKHGIKVISTKVCIRIFDY